MAEAVTTQYALHRLLELGLVVFCDLMLHRRQAVAGHCELPPHGAFVLGADLRDVPTLDRPACSAFLSLNRLKHVGLCMDFLLHWRPHFNPFLRGAGCGALPLIPCIATLEPATRTRPQIASLEDPGTCASFRRGKRGSAPHGRRGNRTYGGSEPAQYTSTCHWPPFLSFSMKSS